MLKDRELNKKYAETHGYFWISDCAICHQGFGGHEKWRVWMLESLDRGMGQIICPECSATRLDERGKRIDRVMVAVL